MGKAQTAESMKSHGIYLVLLYACTIFLSAFLLFQVQPVIGKMLLPWFGGTAAVWSTCLLFFQLLLLFGYLYAHWTSKKLSVRSQGILHISLLALSILVLPVSLRESWKPAGNEDPTLLIIGLMSLSIGLPYFILSSTGPLLQSWFAREKRGTVPYRLFALSNFGSMLGLLSYPAIFEPNLTLSEISNGWSLAYIVFALLCATLAWRGMAVTLETISPVGIESSPKPQAGIYLAWIALAACPTLLLMAITSHLTQNVAPVPFLWIVPLALYLLSFILCFEGGNWYRRIWYVPLFLLTVAAMIHDLVKGVLKQGVWIPTLLYCAGLFVICMVCHGEVARKKPHPKYLTDFYLMIAIGGALGGIFVAVMAPRLFNSNYEFPIGLLVTVLLVLTIVHHAYANPQKSNFIHKALFNLTILTVGLAVIYTAAGIAKKNGYYHTHARNFYGMLSIADTSSGELKQRQLVHGAILHGAQFMQGERRHWPTTYYGDNGGAGMAVLATRQEGEAQRVGIIGLGTGTMAAYGRPGDQYRFYEINPLVIKLARSEFTFLSDSPANIATILGDARLSLEREEHQQFDVLVVDAFSGDSIPVHLLTREAFSTYFKHMKPDGILAVHISNKNLDLAPVVKHAKDFYRKQARLIDADKEEDKGLSGSTWVLLSDNDKAFKNTVIDEAATALEPDTEIPPWTDDYSSIYTILK